MGRPWGILLGTFVLASFGVEGRAQPTISAAWHFSAAIQADGTLWTWGDGEEGLGLGSSVWTTNRPTQVGSDTDWASISATSGHCLALRTDGSLWSWGDNYEGQLGLGDDFDRDLPTRVGAGTAWVQVASADEFSVAIQSDGSLWAWGDNHAGQLGLGHEVATNVPTRVGAGTNWAVVSATVSHCLALQADGSLWAWGDNYSGELGLGNGEATNLPVRVGMDTDWVAIAAGDDHSLALRSDGSLWAWGRNSSAELGLTGIDGTNVPARVGTGTNWSAISTGGGENSLALQSDGSLWAWGGNEHGQCGLGFTSYAVETPTRVGTATNWSVIAAGAEHALALNEDGALWAFGGNEDDALGTDSPRGLGTSVVRRVLKSRWRTPVGTSPTGRVIGLDGDLDFGEVPLTQGAQRFVNIFNDGDTALQVTGLSHSAPEFSGTTNAIVQPGEYVSAAITCLPTTVGEASGTLTVQSDANGGDPAIIERVIGGPALDIGVDTFEHLLSSGGVAPWRIDTVITHDGTDAVRSGPINDGQASTMETRVYGAGQVTFWWKVSSQAGADHLRCYVDGILQFEISGEVNWQQRTLNLGSGWHTLRWTYSKDASGASGLDAGFVDQLVIPATSPSTRRSIDAGGDHSAGIDADGSLWTWGGNDDGELGLGDYMTRSAPTRVGSESNWAEVTAGWHFTCGLQTNGTLWAWGVNWDGQLGLGDDNERNVPTRVGAASNWVTVTAGQDYTMAIRADGTLWAWGWNGNGQLGTADVLDRLAPERVGTNTDWIAIACQESVSLGLRTDGTLWAWGYNRVGALGLGDNMDRLVPTRVGSATNWMAIAIGNGGSFALRTDGTLWAWGREWTGLGDTLRHYTPTQVGSATNWTAIAAGDEHACGIRSDGTLWSWGLNNEGQLGLGDFANRTFPVQVGMATNWLALSGGDAHSLALRTDGTLWVAGFNEYGQLGLGPYGSLNELSFVRVAGPRWRAPGPPALQDRVIALSGSLTFGSIFVGSSAQRNLTIFNDGDEALTVVGITHGDVQFSGTFSGIIPAGQYTNVTISFHPTTAGPVTATFSVQSDASSGGSSAAETGSGVVIVPVDDALDATALTWITYGDVAWHGRENAATAHDGLDSARSGDIDDDQTSFLETSITGPGRISFWWRVSSEEDYDYLEFHVDGILQAALSGEIDWQQVAYDIPAGPHSLGWRYSKDGSESDGEDAGWVDEVSWRPGNTYLLWAQGAFSEGERNDPSISGFWSDRDGDGLPNGLEAVLGTDPKDGADGPLVAPRCDTIGAAGDAHLGLGFVLTQPYFLGIGLRVEASASLMPGSWTTIAQGIDGDVWTGPANVTETPLPGGRVHILVEDLTPISGTSKRFLRLVAEETD